MNNPFDEIQQALSAAADVQRAADRNATSMAKMLRGRLRHVDQWTLGDLKRELRDFNMVTGEWKGQP